MPPTPLPLIIAFARAGALDQAWERFVAEGYDRLADDPVALSVKGRLLKDRAARGPDADRGRLYAEAAEAYRRSATVRPATYPMINAATLYLLAGKEPAARELAAEVIERLERHPAEPETPYYGEATRAEALLLLRREREAQAALAAAISRAPRAWEDHASTLRQFASILAAQGVDGAWLDAHRPPQSLHFGGHMSFHPEIVQREHLNEKIVRVLDEERIGFGFGALAAGADLIIAEALLERGAELHAILPGGRDAFARVSVDPFGELWRRRFDAALEKAESVRTVRPLGIEPDSNMIALGDEIAMGAALTNAQRLEGRAVQLLVLADGASERTREAWAEGGWRQRIISAAREEVPNGFPPTPSRAWNGLAILCVAVGQPDGEPNELEARLERLQDALAGVPAPIIPAHLSGERATLAWRTTAEAARAAAAIAEKLSPEMPVRIGGHYGVARAFRDPFSGADRLAGDAVTAAAGAMASAPAGTTYITADFAAALIAAGPDVPRSEYVGELDAPDSGPPTGLHVLKSSP